MNPVIQTFTGRQVNPLELSIGDICIEDIAHALALCNRFAGHTKRPISVAQHSVFVARMSGEYALQGLLHDASEAYLGDITKWLKQTKPLKAFRDAEDQCQRLIYTKFDCCWTMKPEVELADRIMVRFEGERGLGKDFKIDHPQYPRLTAQERKSVGPWGFWTWQWAEELFLTTFRSLTTLGTVLPAREDSRGRAIEGAVKVR